METLLAYLSSNTAAFISLCVVLGLLVGSFLNVVIHRLPKMLERQWQRECAELKGAAVTRILFRNRNLGFLRLGLRFGLCLALGLPCLRHVRLRRRLGTGRSLLRLRSRLGLLRLLGRASSTRNQSRNADQPQSLQ